MGGLTDRTGRATFRRFVHVKILRKGHRLFGRTGTVVRVDPVAGRVWISFPEGVVVPVSRRSVQILSS